jgi:hypothetical protein
MKKRNVIMQLIAKCTNEIDNSYSIGTTDFGIGMLIRCSCDKAEFTIYSLRAKNEDNTFVYIMKDKHRSIFNVKQEHKQ